MANERFIKGAIYIYTNPDFTNWVGVRARASRRIEGTNSARFTLLSLPHNGGYDLGEEVGFALNDMKLVSSGYSGWVKRMKL